MTTLHRWLAVLGLMLASGSAGAHTLPRSNSTWLIDGESLRVLYQFSGTDAARVIGYQEASGGSDRQKNIIAQYLSSKFNVRRGGRLCEPREAPDVTLSASGGIARWDYRCGPSGEYEISSSAFVDVNSSHTQLVRVVTSTHDMFEFALTASSPLVRVSGSATGSQSWIATATKFMAVGVTHISTGIDHLGFLLGLILMAASWRRLLLLTFGFTVGHSAMLILTASGHVLVRPPLIEALVGFSILLVALDALGCRLNAQKSTTLTCVTLVLIALVMDTESFTRWPDLMLYAGLLMCAYGFLGLARHPAHHAAIQFGLTTAFGLIHGAAFASDLLEQHMSRATVVPALAGFNVGIELGQLMFIAAVASAAALVRPLMRPARVATLRVPAAAILSCTAAWWFVERMAQL